MNNLMLLEKKIYKYKELCDLLGEEYKEGNSKVAQLKEWERYFKFTRITTQKYLVETVYDVPKSKIDGRMNNGGNCTSKYVSLDDIVMEYFCEKGQYSGTLNNFAVELGVLSKVYNSIRRDPERLVKHGYPKEIIYGMLGCVYKHVIFAIRSSFERLDKDKYLNVDRNIAVVMISGEEQLLRMTNEKFIELENDVLEELGKTRKDMFDEQVRKILQDKMIEKLQPEYENRIRYYYVKYDVKLKNKIYQMKSKETIQVLSRKFVKAVSCSMLRMPVHSKRYGFHEEKNEIEKMVKDVKILLEHLFVHINEDSWMKYVMNDETDSGSNKEMTFFVLFCMENSAGEHFDD